MTSVSQKKETKQSMKTTILSLVTLLTVALGAIAEEAPKAESLMLTTLLEATENNDLQSFESICDEAMKEAMNEDTLTQVSKQISPLMKKGYQKTFMGILNRGDAKTYYWKIDFKDDNTPDMLAELTTQEGKVAGFFIR